MKALTVLYLIDAGYGGRFFEHGRQVHLFQILNNLQKLGHRVHLLNAHDKTLLSNFDRDFVGPGLVPSNAKLTPLAGLRDSLKILPAFRKRHQEASFDVIHEFQGLYSVAGLLSARLVGIPYVLEVQAPLIERQYLMRRPLQGGQAWCARFISHLNLKQADVILTLSHFLKRKLVQDWHLRNEKILVVTNAAPGRLFNVNESQKKSNGKGKSKEETLLIGYAGTLQRWFGIENLLYAFQLVSRSVRKARLHIVGDGEHRPALEKLAGDLHIKSKTRFIGGVPHQKIGRYLSKFDIAVAPYRPLVTGFYGSPLKVFEYMAAGKAIVASHIGQIDEILENRRTALLVEPGEIEELAQAILRLALNPDLRNRLGSMAREVAEKNYRWAHNAQKLEKIYRRLISVKNANEKQHQAKRGLD